jgi:hypothetical protein
VASKIAFISALSLAVSVFRGINTPEFKPVRRL